MAEQYLSLEQAAQRLGITPDALNRKRETGEINAVDQGGKWQFLAADIESVADAQVLSGDLDTDEDGSGTVLGSAAEGGKSDEVVLEASDSSVLRPDEPSDEPGSSRTHIGAAGASDSAVRIETSDSGAVLDGMLDGSDKDMQTVLGSEGMKKGPAGSDKITLQTSDSGIQSGAVLEGMLDSPGEGDMQTAVGSGKKSGGSGKIKLETGGDDDDAGMVLEGDLENAGGGPGQTVLGSASGVHDEVEVSTADEDVFDTPGGEPGASKTQVGQPPKSSQSDVQVLVKGTTGGLHADEVQLTPGKGGTESDVRLVSSAGEPTDSDVKLTPGGHEETLSLGDHADLAIDDDSMSIDLGDTEAAMADEATDDTVAPEMDHDEEDVTLDLGGTPEDDEVLDDDEDLTLTAESGGSDITISSSQSGIGVGALGGDSGLSLEQPLDLADGGGSGVDLEADDDDDEFVLSSSGSDITRRPGESGIGIGAGESGIALASLADSGISLETPLDLGGSNTGVSGVSGVGVDDGDFLLTPVDEGDEDDSEDSGSQVIALDADAEGFDEAAATMLAPEEAQGTMLEADYGAPAQAPAQRQAAPQRMGGPAGMVQVQQVPVDMSVPFSGLQVTALSFCMIFLILGGMLTYDLMTNMWAHTDFQSAHYTSAIMDWILDLIEPDR